MGRLRVHLPACVTASRYLPACLLACPGLPESAENLRSRRGSVDHQCRRSRLLVRLITAFQRPAGAAISTFRQPSSPTCLPSCRRHFCGVLGQLAVNPQLLQLASAFCAPELACLLVSAFWFLVLPPRIRSARLCSALLRRSPARFLSACQPKARAFFAAFAAFASRKSAPCRL